MRDSLIELIQDGVGGCARNWAEVIADHLLANGVIVPPVKVGQTVYGIFYPGKVEPITVVEICIGDGDVLILSDTNGEDTFFHPLDIGKTVFLTREEAEKALAERGEK